MSCLQNATANGLFAYFDCHAFTSKQGCYFLGNKHAPSKAARGLTFAMLMQLYAPQFNVFACSLPAIALPAPTSPATAPFVAQPAAAPPAAFPLGARETADSAGRAKDPTLAIVSVTVGAGVVTSTAATVAPVRHQRSIGIVSAAASPSSSAASSAAASAAATPTTRTPASSSAKASRPRALQRQAALPTVGSGKGSALQAGGTTPSGSGGRVVAATRGTKRTTPASSPTRRGGKPAVALAAHAVDECLSPTAPDAAASPAAPKPPQASAVASPATMSKVPVPRYATWRGGKAQLTLSGDGGTLKALAGASSKQAAAASIALTCEHPS